MEKYLKSALLSIAAVMSSGIYGNRFHVFLYNYTPYKVEGTASFFCGITPMEFSLNPAPAKSNTYSPDQATMARADVTDCAHTGMNVTVTKPDGTQANLHYNLKVSDNVWYEIKEISTASYPSYKALVLTYSNAQPTSTDRLGNQIWLMKPGAYQITSSERIVDQDPSSFSNMLKEGIIYNNTDFITPALIKKADPNMVVPLNPTTSTTPLKWAIDHKNTPIINLLLSEGVDLADINNYSAIPTDILDYVPVDYNLIKYLIDKGARDTSGKILITAVQVKNLRLVQILMQNGSNTKLTAQDTAKKNKGNTALITAALSNANDIAQVLLDPANNPSQFIDIQNKDGMTALMVATEQLNLDLVKLLLKAGANKNLTDKKGRDATGIAVSKANSQLIALLQGQ